MATLYPRSRYSAITTSCPALPTYELFAIADALPALADLLDASLVHVDMVGTQTRFRMLEVSRDYALARLHEAGEEEACRRRHALWFAELATDSSGLSVQDGQLKMEQTAMGSPNTRGRGRPDTVLLWPPLDRETVKTCAVLPA